MRATSRAARIVVAAFGSLPLLVLVLDAGLDRLGPEPVEEITHRTGGWALRMLLLSLAVTPLRRELGLAWLAPHRRTLGLLAFLYAALHFATYLVFDLAFDFGSLGEDVSKRPYITVGFATLVSMSLLALTSTRGWMRRLGRRWVRLHRLVYAISIGAIVHFTWSVKADLREPLIYGAITALLLGQRVFRRLRPLCSRATRGEPGGEGREAMRR